MITILKKGLLVISDAVLIMLALYLALVIRFEGSLPADYLHELAPILIYTTGLKLAVFYLFQLYRSLWRYAGAEGAVQIGAAAIVAEAACLAAEFLLSEVLPSSVHGLSLALTVCFLGGARMLLRKSASLRLFRAVRRAMIVGAGSAGAMLLRELRAHPEIGLRAVLFVDDDPAKQNQLLGGVHVRGGSERIPQLAKQYRVDEIIFAIPSARKGTLLRLYDFCKGTGCALKTLPSLRELLNGDAALFGIRSVRLEDLLRREPVRMDTAAISGYLQGETVLITGGGGSIGSEICRQAAQYAPRRIILFDICENSVYELQNELRAQYKSDLDLKVIIGSCRDRERLREVFDTYRPDIVFHAAAHKHVPLMEDNPAEAVKNNVFGTLNTARRAEDFHAKKFILISTDKAVNPTNIMGASKRLAEIIVQSMNGRGTTVFSAVRFGNVLGSSGSVVPLFQRQIQAGGPVTVTHPDIIRYFMTIPEAVQLVLQAGALAREGEVFVLDMGDPVRIADMARDLIRLSGFEPDVDIKIEYVGLRPGEKLFEEMLMSEEGLSATRYNKIYVGRQAAIPFSEVIAAVRELEQNLHSDEAVRACMARLVPTYTAQRQQLTVIELHKGAPFAQQNPADFSGAQPINI